MPVWQQQQQQQQQGQIAFPPHRWRGTSSNSAACRATQSDRPKAVSPATIFVIRCPLIPTRDSHEQATHQLPPALYFSLLTLHHVWSLCQR